MLIRAVGVYKRIFVRILGEIRHVREKESASCELTLVDTLNTLKKYLFRSFLTRYQNMRNNEESVEILYSGKNVSKI